MRLDEVAESLNVTEVWTDSNGEPARHRTNVVVQGAVIPGKRPDADMAIRRRGARLISQWR